MRLRTAIVGRGRAGGAFAVALRAVGWDVSEHSHTAANRLRPADAELVLLCVPDAAVAEVAVTMPADPSRVVAHCAGSLGLGVLGHHPRRASVHPLVALADPQLGAAALRGAWFAVAGDPVAERVAAALEGTVLTVGDEHRVRYHAAAVVASNHLVALLGQVDRLAASIGVPLEAYLELVRATVDNVAAVGPRAALTGPVARGDWATVAAHLNDLPPDERSAYLALAGAAARLVGAALPDGLSG